MIKAKVPKIYQSNNSIIEKLIYPHLLKKIMLKTKHQMLKTKHN